MDSLIGGVRTKAAGLIGILSGVSGVIAGAIVVLKEIAEGTYNFTHMAAGAAGIQASLAVVAAGLGLQGYAGKQEKLVAATLLASPDADVREAAKRGLAEKGTKGFRELVDGAGARGIGVSAIAVLLTCAIGLAGCTSEQKRLWCRTVATIDQVAPVAAIGVQFVPALAPGWGLVHGAWVAASGGLRAACARGEAEGPELDTAVRASIDLLAWYQAHRAEIAAATPAGTRGLEPPDDVAQVLEQLEAYQAKAKGGR